jgi:ribosome-binding ATPase YchF (GTP1/OBG family)
MVDCAGLVPDAWQGRGLGNYFLDEIRKADALIHVVDASGETDLEGRPVKTGSHDPVEDVHFLEKELNMWIAQILKKGWSKLKRGVESGKTNFYSSLEEKLSGLSIKRNKIIEAARKAGLNQDKPPSWNDREFMDFVNHLRSKAKPMLIAANKIDKSEAEDNIERLRDTGYPVSACSAEAELALRRASEKGMISYKPGDSSFTILKPEVMTKHQVNMLEIIRKRILGSFGTTGVQECVNAASFDLLEMIVVYTVEDAEKLTDHDGRVLPNARILAHGTTARELAYKIHTELGDSFIYAVDVRTKKRLGENYVLCDRDIISIASAKKRG